MNAVVAIAWKDLRLLVRDPVALFWAMVFPILFAGLFGTLARGTIDGSGRRLSLAVADEDRSALSHALVDALVATGSFEVRVTSASDGQTAVRRGDVVAVLVVPSGFGASGAAVDLGVDPARTAEAAYSCGIMTETIVRLRTPEGDRSAKSGPVRVSSILADESRARSGYEVVFPAAILWGLIGCAGSFAVAMVSERRSGTYVRLLSAPISPAAILAGKALACFLACVADAWLLILIARFVFGVRVESRGVLAVALLASATCFTGITLLLSVLGRSEQSVGGAGWGALLLMAMLGGAMVPVAAMPAWMQTASHASPVRWGIVALEGATFRGLSLAELSASFVVLIGVGGAAFLASIVMAPEGAS